MWRVSVARARPCASLPVPWTTGRCVAMAPYVFAPELVVDDASLACFPGESCSR